MRRTSSIRVPRSIIHTGLAFAALSCSLLLAPFGAQGANKTWTGGINTDWGTAGNWSGGVPGVGDSALFNSSSTANTSTTLGATSYSIQDIKTDSTLANNISIGGTGTLTFNTNGIAWFNGVTKNLSISAPVIVPGTSITQAWWAEPGTTVSISGSVTVNQNLWLRGNSGDTGAGTFVFSGGGTVASGKNFIVGDSTFKGKLEIAGGLFDASASNSALFGSDTSTLTVSGGTFKPSSTNNLNVSNSTVINVTGGILDASGMSANDVIIGQTSTGALNVSAGQFIGSSTRILYVGNSAGGNGTLKLSGTGIVDLANAASTIVVGRATTGIGVLDLDGGTLLTSRSIRGSDSGAGNGTVNLNGGTLKAKDGNNANWLLSASTFNAIVKNGGAKFDTNGFNMGIPVVLQHGALATTDSLTKNGNGTLTLTANNTYTGNTTVNSGTLALSHASTNNIGSSPVIRVDATLDVTSLSASTLALTAGQTLQGSGTVLGNVTAATAGSTISPGNSIESLLISGDITFGAGGNFDYEIDSNAALAVGADLLYGDGGAGGGLNISGSPTLSLSDLGSGSVAAGTKFTLIAYDIGEWNGGIFAGRPDDSLIYGFGGINWFINYNDTSAGSNFPGDADDNTAWLTITATTVPEPSTYALGLVGLVALACRAWGRKRGTGK